MTKWEYCQIITPYGGFMGFIKSSTGLVFYKSSDKVEEIEVENIGAVLAKLGLDGWELVSHSMTTDPNKNIYTFKRPLTD